MLEGRQLAPACCREFGYRKRAEEKKMDKKRLYIKGIKKR